MRKLIVLAMVAGLVGVGVFTRDARAGATVDILFIGKNGSAIAPTNTVTAAVSDTLTMALRMTSDQPLVAAVFSLNYDLDSDNELDVVSAFVWVGVALNKSATIKMAPLGGLDPITATFVGAFQGQGNDFDPPVVGLPGGTAYQMGTVIWHVNAGVNNDGADILAGSILGGDVFGDIGFNNITSSVLYRAATVNLVPEPGTASLLGLGLVGLVLAGRRSRS